MHEIEEHDHVELLINMGEIKKGMQGTVVYFSESIPDLFAVEFCDQDGITLEIIDVRLRNLRLLEKAKLPSDS